MRSDEGPAGFGVDRAADRSEKERPGGHDEARRLLFLIPAPRPSRSYLAVRIGGRLGSIPLPW